MKEQKKKVPDLRFKGFTDDWEQHKLGDALEEFSYGLNTPATKFDGKNKYLRITDIDDDTHAFNQTSLTSPKDKDDNYILGQGDILFARTGASVGKTYMYKANDGKVYYAGFLIKGHIKNGFSTEFIFNTTRLPQYQNFVKVTSMRSGQPGINAKEYQNYVIYVPVKQEQERIGQLISKLDTLITLHQRKLVLLKQLKKGLLQKMFADKGSKRPILRFECFNDDWESVHLGNILKERNDKSQANDEYPLMSFVQGKGVTPKSTRYNREFLVKDSHKKYKKTELGDFIYSSNNLDTGSIGFNQTGKAVISPVYSIFYSKNNQESKLIGVLSQRKDFINKMIRYRQGVVYGQWKIHEQDFLNIKIRIPHDQEQVKIINEFNTLYQSLKVQKERLKLLNQLKKALLQQMFI